MNVVNTLIEHHVKYKELHGVDETVWMTKSEHKKLHNRLRKEGKCNVSPDLLNTIAIAAHNRTNKAKEWRKIYNKTSAIIQYCSEYQKRNRFLFNFYESMMPNVVHHEIITYNISTGSVIVTCYFKGNNGKKLFYIGDAT